MPRNRAVIGLLLLGVSIGIKCVVPTLAADDPVGDWVGTGDGNLWVSIREGRFNANYIVADITVSTGVGRCGGSVTVGGELDGRTIRAVSNEPLNSMAPICRVDLEFGRDSLRVAEVDGCTYYHGAACGFSGNLTRKGGSVANKIVGWYPGEVVEDTGTPFKGRTIVERRGTTPDGVNYHYYADGGGGIEAEGADLWSFQCSTDAMNDVRTCTITPPLLVPQQGQVMLTIGGNGRPSAACVVGHDFPGRLGAIRVNDNQPLVTDHYGCVSASRFLSELTTSNRPYDTSIVTTRRVTWPYDNARDERFPVIALTKAVELAQFIQAEIDHIPFEPNSKPMHSSAEVQPTATPVRKQWGGLGADSR